jgi:hypothetical protein
MEQVKPRLYFQGFFGLSMNIIEIVFENIPRHQLPALIKELYEGEVDDKTLFDELTSNQAFYLNFSEFKCSSFTLWKPSIRVIQYEGKFDLELSFDSGKQAGLTHLKLSVFFSDLAHKYHVEQVYGGFEPASDVDTRIFTDLALGPVQLKIPAGS